MGLLELRFLNRVAVAIVSRLPKRSWRIRFPVVDGEGLIDVGGESPVVLRKAEKCKLARELYWNDGALASADDRRSLDLAVALCADADLFLDVGAYTGLFALAAARRHPRLLCHAYEIVPENYELLLENIDANGLGARVCAHFLGLGQKPGMLQVPAAFGPGVLPSSVALDSQSDAGVGVRVSTLDDELPDFDGRLVCKLDVETFEVDVLRGGRELIERTLPDLLCEVLPRSHRTMNLQEFLAERGYSFFHITDCGLQHKARIEPHRRFWNWLFTTRTETELREAGIGS